VGALSAPLFGLLVGLLIPALAGAWLVSVKQADRLREKLLAEAAAHLDTVNRLAEAQRNLGLEVMAKADLAERLAAEEKAAGDAEGEAAELTRALRDARAIVPVAVLPRAQPTKAERDALLASKCAHCGGSHAIACPRVRRMRFRPDGQSLYEVEFWETWDQSRVVFVEDLFEEHNAEGESVPASPAVA
jgi:hypothetical protein